MGALNVENANIEAMAEYDKKKKDLSDKLTNLQGKLKVEGGKKEVVDGVPISEDDIAELVGGKASYNLAKNAYHSYSTSFTKAQNIAQGRALLTGAEPQAISKLQKTQMMGQSLLDGFKSSTTKSRQESGLKQAVEKATQKATQAGKTGEELVEAGKVAKEEFLKGGIGGVFGKIGAGVAVADGLALANQDIQGLREGKGWDSFGNNWEERTSNITGMVGDALSLFPPTEVLGGVVDVASGIFDWLGERKEDLETQQQVSDTQKAQAKNKVPPVQTMAVHPSMASIGMVANVSHPLTDMIQGSGVF